MARTQQRHTTKDMASSLGMADAFGVEFFEMELGAATERQFCIDVFASRLPVLIGGDLNIGNHIPPKFDWRDETPFDRAEARSYDWSFTAHGRQPVSA